MVLLDMEKKMTKRIYCNWNDLESIDKATKQKDALENKGYNLIKTISTPDSCVLIYGGTENE